MGATSDGSQKLRFQRSSLFPCGEEGEPACHPLLSAAQLFLRTQGLYSLFCSHRLCSLGSLPMRPCSSAHLS